jgi:hypothetical protein
MDPSLSISSIQKEALRHNFTTSKQTFDIKHKNPGSNITIIDYNGPPSVAPPGVPSAPPGVPSASTGVPSASTGVPSASTGVPSSSTGVPSAPSGVPSGAIVKTPEEQVKEIIANIKPITLPVDLIKNTSNPYLIKAYEIAELKNKSNNLFLEISKRRIKKDTNSIALTTELTKEKTKIDGEIITIKSTIPMAVDKQIDEYYHNSKVFELSTLNEKINYITNLIPKTIGTKKAKLETDLTKLESIKTKLENDIKMLKP